MDLDTAILLAPLFVIVGGCALGFIRIELCYRHACRRRDEITTVNLDRLKQHRGPVSYEGSGSALTQLWHFHKWTYRQFYPRRPE